MAAEIALAKDTMFRDAIRKVVQVKCQMLMFIKLLFRKQPE